MTQEKYIRSILAYKNPLVHNFQGMSYSEIIETGNPSLKLSTIIRRAKEAGHDGVIFLGLRDPEWLDVHYATPIELGSKNIIRLESSFETNSRGPYRRGLNGQEGAGERFQAADIGPEESEPRRRSRKSRDEIEDELDMDANLSSRDKDFTEDFTEEEQASLFEQGEDIVSRRVEEDAEDYSKIHEIETIDELIEFQKENNFERGKVLRERLQSLSIEISDMKLNGQEVPKELATFKKELDKRVKAFETPKEDVAKQKQRNFRHH
jgi:hypothetical protein